MNETSGEATQPFVLVTGATGYIGGRLVPRLLGEGFRVRCLARDAVRLHDRPWREQVEVIEGDVLRAETLLATMRDVTADPKTFRNSDPPRPVHARPGTFAVTPSSLSSHIILRAVRLRLRFGQIWKSGDLEKPTWRFPSSALADPRSVMSRHRPRRSRNC